MLTLLLLIAAGGFAGACARYLVSGWVLAWAGSAFPWGTLAVNVLGSFALGLVLPALPNGAALTPTHAFVVVGCIGSFTTFSTFAYDASRLIERRQWARAAAYALLSFVLGFASLSAGLLLRGVLMQ